MNNHPEHLLMKGAIVVLSLTLVMATQKGDYTIGDLKVTIQGDSTHSSATGLYLLAQEVQHDGNLTSLEACGYFNNTKSSFQTRNSTSFYIIVYRSMDGKYVRIYKPYVFVHDINGNETFGCYEHNVTKQELILLTGDRIGVFVPETECFNFDLKNSCTYGFHVNIIDPIVNSSQVYYVVNSSDFTMKEFPQVLNLKDIQSANIFINMELCFSVTSSTSAIPATIRSEIIAIPASVGITIVMIVMLLVLVTGVVVGHHRRTRGGTKEQETTVTVIDASVATDAERTYSHLNYRIYNHQDGFLNGEPTMNRKMVSTPNDYSVSVGSSQGLRIELRNDRSEPSHVSDAHHYEKENLVERELLVGTEHDYEYEDEYWEPAMQETQLKQQLTCLNVKETSIDDLEIKAELGSGQFATVSFALWKERNGVITEVAVKTLKGDPISVEKKVQFLREAAIMGQFEHPNILQILAVAYGDEMKPFLVVDLMHTGDLLHHLRSLQTRGCHEDSQKLCQTLLSYSRQIAFGMLYLGCKKFIHRDLAARNVLVSNDGTCKIADFGLSRNLLMDDYYISQGGKIPVKWTAPEALHYRKYSTASDVWSYGCLLYEIWSLGVKPFSKLSNIEVLRQIAAGYRLPPPPGCPKAIYSVMINCWNPEASVRPSFMKIVVALQRPDFQILFWSPKDVTSYSKATRTLGGPLADGECLYKNLQHIYMSKTVKQELHMEARSDIS